MGGIRCARCGSDNAVGSRFCGVCGVRLGTAPPLQPAPAQSSADADAADAPAGGTSRAPAREPTARGDESPDASLGRSLELPVSRGARAATILIVLAVDAALVVAGVWMWRAANAHGAVSDAGPSVVAGAGDPLDAGEIPAARPDAATAVSSPSVTAPSRPSPAASAPRPAPSIPSVGPGPGAGPDAGMTLDERIGLRDAAVPDAAPADAGALAPEPPDAEPPDAPSGPLDPYEEPEAEPSDPGAPLETEDDSAIVDAADAVARLTSRSQRRFERCYQQAAKAYPPEQPLEGDVDIAMRVMPTGEVREVSAVRNTTGSEQLARCLVAIIEGWRVAAGGGEAVDLVRPFRFGAQP